MSRGSGRGLRRSVELLPVEVLAVSEHAVYRVEWAQRMTATIATIFGLPFRSSFS
mgnify:CR=1 FL=1